MAYYSILRLPNKISYLYDLYPYFHDMYQGQDTWCLRAMPTNASPKAKKTRLAKQAW